MYKVKHVLRDLLPLLDAQVIHVNIMWGKRKTGKFSNRSSSARMMSILYTFRDCS